MSGPPSSLERQRVAFSELSPSAIPVGPVDVMCTSLERLEGMANLTVFLIVSGLLPRTHANTWDRGNLISKCTRHPQNTPYAPGTTLNKAQIVHAWPPRTQFLGDSLIVPPLPYHKWLVIVSPLVELLYSAGSMCPTLYWPLDIPTPVS